MAVIMQKESGCEPTSQETAAKERAHNSVKLLPQRFGKVEAVPQARDRFYFLPSTASLRLRATHVLVNNFARAAWTNRAEPRPERAFLCMNTAWSPPSKKEAADRDRRFKVRI